jgi:hypothetical protein
VERDIGLVPLPRAGVSSRPWPEGNRATPPQLETCHASARRGAFKATQTAGARGAHAEDGPMPCPGERCEAEKCGEDGEAPRRIIASLSLCWWAVRCGQAPLSTTGATPWVENPPNETTDHSDATPNNSGGGRLASSRSWQADHTPQSAPSDRLHGLILGARS